MTTITQPSLALPVGMPYLPDSNYAGLSGHVPTSHGTPAKGTEGSGHADHAAAGANGPSPAAAGKGFEELFASILIKHMRQASGEHGLFGHDPGDVLGGMFDHFMSQHVAQAGKLGIGKMIQTYMEKRSENHEQSAGSVMPRAS